MKHLIIALVAFISLSATAATIVKGEPTLEHADLCFLKQVQLRGYAYANVVGRCALDAALNGMSLSLVAVPEDVMEEQRAFKVDLGIAHGVSAIAEKNGQLQVSVTNQVILDDGRVQSLKRSLLIKTLDLKSGTFGLSEK